MYSQSTIIILCTFKINISTMGDNRFIHNQPWLFYVCISGLIIYSNEQILVNYSLYLTRRFWKNTTFEINSYFKMIKYLIFFNINQFHDL